MRCIFLLDKIHCRFDNACVHSYNLYDSTMLVSARTTRTTRQLIAWAPVYLMRCIFPLDKIHCRLEMFVSTRTIRTTRQCLCPLERLVRLDNGLLGPLLPNEMQFSTRQNSLSTRQCLCPLVQPARLDNACVHSNDSYDSTTDCLGPCLPNEMQFST